MSSDPNQPNDQYDQDAPRANEPEHPVEDAVSAAFDPLVQQVQDNADIESEPAVQEPGDTLAEPDPVIPADRPGASSTTGTGTSIAIGCVAVCAVILLITILVLTIVS